MDRFNYEAFSSAVLIYVNEPEVAGVRFSG
jgi:hypothetical protein